MAATDGRLERDRMAKLNLVIGDAAYRQQASMGKRKASWGLRIIILSKLNSY